MSTDPTKDTALPLGMWMIVYFREPIGQTWSVEGNIDFCGPYRVRIIAADGTTTFCPHSNILGAVGERVR